MARFDRGVATAGVFLVPPAGHPLYDSGSEVLGYDIRARARGRSLLCSAFDEETVTTWLGPAPTFGMHMTIAAGWLQFDERDLGEVDVRLQWLASRLAPFGLSGGRFADEFEMRPRGLVATYDSSGGALQRLERQVVTLVSPMRSGSRYDDRRDAYPEDRRRALDRHGDPNAAEFFVPHWSFASGMPDAAAYHAVREAITAGTPLFSEERAQILPAVEMHLVRQGDDGYYVIAASYLFSGTG